MRYSEPSGWLLVTTSKVLIASPAAAVEMDF